MDMQDIWTASLVAPAALLGIVAWSARRRGRTTFGLGLRAGGVGEFLRGCAFSVPFFAAMVAVLLLSGAARVDDATNAWLPALGIAVYFLVLFVLEEIAFRSLLMTGLGVLAGQWVALGLTAVLVAGAYAFAPHTGVLPVLGAVVTNLLTGLARWRSGRIWWGLGQRWLWNAAMVGIGFTDSAYRLDRAVLDIGLDGPDWVTGGGFGLEGGLVGIAFQLAMIAAACRFATGRRGPWRIAPTRRLPSEHDAVGRPV